MQCNVTAPSKYDALIENVQNVLLRLGQGYEITGCKVRIEK